jgi:uncharacterized protein YbjQ (UPF0145 family)
MSTAAVEHHLASTTNELVGFRIVQQLGIVRGITVRSRSVVGNFGAAVQGIFGGKITVLADLCEHARDEAFELMLAHAGELGANAVIGVRYDATELLQGMTEVLAYGTAVVAEPA